MGREPEPREYMTSLRVYNARPVAVTFVLEPWGEHYTMAPEATFDVVARGPEGDSLEIEFTDDHIVLYGWPGSIVNVFQEGTELGVGCSERLPSPSTPSRNKTQNKRY